MPDVNRDSEWMVKSLNAEGAQYDYYENLWFETWKTQQDTPTGTDVDVLMALFPPMTAKEVLTLKELRSVQFDRVGL